VPLVINEWNIDGKLILEAIIPEGANKPFFALGEDKKWWVYIRVKDQSLLASKIVVDVLRNQAENRNTFIEYGPREKGLIEYLSSHQRITLREFCKLMNISKWRASKILIKMLSAGIIRSHNTEKTEFYTLS
jgi:predicted HTH transcriptional regulator